MNKNNEHIITVLPECCKNEYETRDALQNNLYKKYKKHVIILTIIFIMIAIIISQCKLIEITSESVPYRWCLLLKNIPPRRGDLCVLDYDGRTVVKYLRGKAGDEIRISNNSILVNGKIAEKISDEKRFEMLDFRRVPEGKVFVLGTHPDSFDSRYKKFGFVEESAIKGMAIGLKKR